MFKALLSRLWRDRRANALMLTAFALPVVIGAAGLGIHTIDLSLAKRQLQREADSAAMAGAYSLFQNQGNTAARQAAENAIATHDLVSNAASTIVIGPFTANGTTFPESVHVALSATRPTVFMRLFGRDSVVVRAEARAATVPEGDLCAFARKTTGVGITIGGNTTMNLGCGIGTNANGAPAVIQNGNSASVNASPIVAVGSIEQGIFNNSVLMPNHDPMQDPFAGMQLNPSSTEVSDSACKAGSSWNTIVVANNTTSNLSSSVFGGCFGTISVGSGATLTLGAGTYYLANGANNAGLQVNGTLNCTGCVFVLTSTTPNQANSHAKVNMNSSGVLNVSAPSTGTYAGIMFYRDNRASASNQCCTINGNTGGSLSGAIYMPNDNLTFNGSGNFTTSCLHIVTWSITFTGNSTVNNTCTPPGDPSAWTLDNVRLIA